MESVERRTLFVGNLSQDVNEALLHELCLQAGPVESVVIARPKKLRDEGKKQIDKTAAADAHGDGTKTVMYNANGFNPTVPFRREDEVAYVEVRGCFYFIQNNASYYDDRQTKAQVSNSAGTATENDTEIEKSEEDAKQLEKGTDKEDEQNGIEEAKVDQDAEEEEAKVAEGDVSGPSAKHVSEKTLPPEEKLVKESEHAPCKPQMDKDSSTTQQKDPRNQEKDPNPNRHLGYGFVLFEHECSVGYAIQVFRGTELFGRRLTLQFKTKNGAKINRAEPDNNHSARYQPDNSYNARWNQYDNKYNSRGNQNLTRGKPIYNFHNARVTSYQGNRYPGSRGYANDYWNEQQEFPESVNNGNFRLATGNRERNVPRDDFAYVSRPNETLRPPNGNRDRNAPQEDFTYVQRPDETLRIPSANRNRNATQEYFGYMTGPDEIPPEYENYYSTRRFTDKGAMGNGRTGGYEAEYQKQEATLVKNMADLSLQEKKEMVEDVRRPVRRAPSVRENVDGRKERRAYESDRRRVGRPTYEDFVLKYDRGETDANARKKPSECYVKLSESFDVALDKFKSAKLEGEEREPAKPRRRKNRKK